LYILLDCRLSAVGCWRTFR